MPDPNRRRSSPDRERWLLFAAVALAVTGIGFLTGTNPDEYVAKRPPSARPAPDRTAAAPPARSHAELGQRPWGASPERSGWDAVREAGRIDRAKATDTLALERGRSNGPETETALAERQARRAFAGAPPVIPHPIRQNGASECLA